MTDLLTPVFLFRQFDWLTFLAMFWFVIVIEIPRYTLAGLAVFVHWAFSRPRVPSPAQRAYLDSLRVSVQIAGALCLPTRSQICSSLMRNGWRWYSKLEMLTTPRLTALRQRNAAPP
jgi:hypothetical protein